MLKKLLTKTNAKVASILATGSAVLMAGPCFAEGTETTATTLADVVTIDMFQGILDNILVVIPVVVGGTCLFIGFRKGWGFIMRALHRV